MKVNTDDIGESMYRFQTIPINDADLRPPPGYRLHSWRQSRESKGVRGDCYILCWEKAPRSRAEVVAPKEVEALELVLWAMGSKKLSSHQTGLMMAARDSVLRLVQQASLLRDSGLRGPRRRK